MNGNSILKSNLLDKLKQECCFWSYDPGSVTLDTISDDMLIEKTLIHLDLDDIALLFKIYPYKQVKAAWLEYLVPQEEYLYTLNRFFAWYYFHVKRPDAYIKAMATRHYNKVS